MTKTPILTLADGYPYDLQRLLESRGLATAASGSGKSWLLRRIIEQALPHVQVFILDPEGEFHTLREKFEILVCAPEGADAVATPATAALLVRSLLETAAPDRLGVSAVFNIYDLKAYERQAFVRAFCEALVNAPRPLWHNVLIVIDEAHIFCPEGSKSESGQAVIDLATRGRKRGFGLMLATQRLAKLHKDAAGEMLNKLIGRTSLINDIKRAADELGESPKEMAGKLRDLAPGEWYAYGPAFPEGIQRIKVGPVVTTHPRPGNRLLEAPAAPGPQIRALLAERLKDLPQQAAQEAVTLDQLRAQLQESQQAVKRLLSQTGPQGIPEAEVLRRIQEAQAKAFNEGAEMAMISALKLRALLEMMLEAIPAGPEAWIENPTPTLPLPNLQAATESFLATFAHEPVAHEHRPGGKGKIPERPFLKDGTFGGDGTVRYNGKAYEKSIQATVRKYGGGDLSTPQQTILDTLAQFDTYGVHQLNRTILAVQAGVSAASSGFQNNLGKLRTLGLLDYPASGIVGLTEAGRSQARTPATALTLSEFHNAWFRMLPSPQAAILEALLGVYPKDLDRKSLSDKVYASPSSSGFQNNLGRLRSMGAIEYPATGIVKASAIMFPQGVKS